jgi:hypothetical protein
MSCREISLYREILMNTPRRCYVQLANWEDIHGNYGKVQCWTDHNIKNNTTKGERINEETVARIAIKESIKQREKYKNKDKFFWWHELFRQLNSPLSENVLLCSKVFQASPACPSERSNIKMENSVEQWWNDTDGRKNDVIGENPVSVPFCPR